MGKDMEFIFISKKCNKTEGKRVNFVKYQLAVSVAIT